MFINMDGILTIIEIDEVLYCEREMIIVPYSYRPLCVVAVKSITIGGAIYSFILGGAGLPTVSS